MLREAIVVRREGEPTVERVQNYLPSNYVVQSVTEEEMRIVGQDFAGWTLDGYVIPRLASGLIFASERERA